MRYSKTFCLFFLLIIFNVLQVTAQVADLTLKSPFESDKPEENNPTQIEIKTIPNFPKPPLSRGSFHIDSRLKLSLDTFINTKTAMAGDFFKARVLEDFFIPTNPPALIIPKGTWVRGRVSYIKKPGLFIKTGKIGLHLDYLTTSLGDIVPLNAELIVQQGIINENGILYPLSTSKLPNQALPESLNTISISNLDTKAAGSLVNGSLFVLFAQGDNVTLNQGQELQVVLIKDINLN